MKLSTTDKSYLTIRSARQRPNILNKHLNINNLIYIRFSIVAFSALDDWQANTKNSLLRY